MSELRIQYRAPQSIEWHDPWPRIGTKVKKERETLEAKAKAARTHLNEMLLASLQMRHLVVLAGSGTSLDRRVKGPSMDDLWRSVECLSDDEGHVLKRESVCKEIRYEGTNIEEFLSQCEAFLQVYKDDKVVRSFYSKSKETILQRCSFPMSPDSLSAHTAFLLKLSRRRVRDPRLKLFTTNYDLCFETAARIQGLVAIDGFSFSEPRQYDPRYFGYDIVRRSPTGEDTGHYVEGVFLLYKLHGSVNWARVRDGVIIKSNPDASEACLIYPAGGKYQQSYSQPHLELTAQYLSSLRESNTCLLVIGFGLADKHLAEPLLLAVATNPHLRLIVVDTNAQKHLSQDTPNYWTRLDELAARGFDIWFINSSFEDFVTIIPDLKALTPAEQLVESLRKVTAEQ